MVEKKIPLIYFLRETATNSDIKILTKKMHSKSIRGILSPFHFTECYCRSVKWTLKLILFCSLAKQLISILLTVNQDVVYSFGQLSLTFNILLYNIQSKVKKRESDMG